MEPTDIYLALFSAEELMECSTELMMWSGVTMKQDFGPLKKGDRYDLISFEPEISTCKTYTGEDVVTNEFKFKIVAA